MPVDEVIGYTFSIWNILVKYASKHAHHGNGSSLSIQVSYVKRATRLIPEVEM
jgi:hypothetical protein